MAGLNKNFRFPELDIYRGVAVLMMMIYHLIYNLNDYRLTNIHLTNPFWKTYREFLVFIFLAVSGACLHLLYRNGVQWKSFLKRSAINLVGAALVTLSTYIYNKNMIVYFGVLHYIFVASFLALAFVKKPKLALSLGLLILLIGYVGQLNEARNYVPYLSGLGFGSFRLRTYDLFPMIPYFGATLMGIFLVSHALQINSENSFLFFSLNPQKPWNRFFAFLGRHALIIYLIHQPIIVAPFYFLIGH